ncbi:MAG TPA: hypothetical protein VFC11_08295 [Methylocella sp.]|nr:hypothetical protein [Methylocella sp.]
MILSKEQALERMLNAAVRATISLEDPLPVHVILMATYDALREFAKAKSIFIEIEWTDYIKDEFQQKWVNEYFKNKFYFLKHGTPDTASVDFKNIAFLNDMQLLHNVMMYRTIFSRISAHMRQFWVVLVGIYPHLIRWEKMKVPTLTKETLFETSSNLDRKDMLIAFKPIFMADAAVLQEIERDRSLATAELASRREKLKAPKSA